MYVSVRLLTMNCLEARSFTIRGMSILFPKKNAYVYNFCKGPVELCSRNELKICIMGDN